MSLDKTTEYGLVNQEIILNIFKKIQQIIIQAYAYTVR